MITVGLISDTHGLLRPEALHRLEGSDLIVHAGDIGKPEVIDELELIAPVHAIKGNVDTGSWATAYEPTQVVQVDETFIYVLHNLADLDLDPLAAGFQVIISGHSHKPKIEHKNGVLFVNPGSAGPRRFTLPISIARLEIQCNSVQAHIEQIVA